MWGEAYYNFCKGVGKKFDQLDLDIDMEVNPHFSDSFSENRINTFNMSSNNNNNRFEGIINLDALGLSASQRTAVVAAIIGTRGSNIRRLTDKYPGLYIRLYNAEKGQKVRVDGRECDTVYICGRKAEDVSGAASLINQDIQATVDPAKKSSRPTIDVPCPDEAAGTVIGRGGSGLKYIQRLVGNGCYIVHNKDKGVFEIVANKQTSMTHAKVKIEESIKQYYTDQKEWKKRKQGRGGGSETASTGSRNRFALPSDSDTDSDDDSDQDSEDEREAIREAAAKKRAQEDALKMQMFDYRSTDSSGSSSIGAIKDNNRERWAIRETLSKKTDPKTGGPLFPEYQDRDYKTGKRRTFSGVHAVPWEAVDAEMKRLDQEKSRKQSVSARRQAARDLRHQREALKETQWEQLGSAAAEVRPNTHWGGSGLADVKSSEGTDALAENARILSERRQTAERLARAKEERERQERRSSGMVTLGVRRRIKSSGEAKSSTVDLSGVVQAVAQEEEVTRTVDLTPNITLDVQPKPMVWGGGLKPGQSWADVADSEDEESDIGSPHWDDETDMERQRRMMEDDNSAW